MRRRRMKCLALLLPLMVPAACSSNSGPTVCTALFAIPVTVTAVDSATSAPVTLGLAGSITDGSFHGDLSVHGNVLQYTQAERAGTYNVLVQATGYRDWQQNDVVVKKEATGCHVIGVSLQARMVKQ